MIDDFPWTGSEKQIARKAFNNAYHSECRKIIDTAKKMLAQSSAPQDLWKVHDYLTQERRKTDEKYRYRYSVLILVFAKLIHEGRLTENDLDGLHADKLEAIRKYLRFWSKVND